MGRPDDGKMINRNDYDDDDDDDYDEYSLKPKRREKKPKPALLQLVLFELLFFGLVLFCFVFPFRLVSKGGSESTPLFFLIRLKWKRKKKVDRYRMPGSDKS